MCNFVIKISLLFQTENCLGRTASDSKPKTSRKSHLKLCQFIFIKTSWWTSMTGKNKLLQFQANLLLDQLCNAIRETKEAWIRKYAV